MSQYFCHTCNARIDRITEDFTCPTCSDGFVEEISEDSSNAEGLGAGFELGGVGRGRGSPLNWLQFFLDPPFARGSGRRSTAPNSPASPTASSSYGQFSSRTAPEFSSQSDPHRQRHRGPQQFSFYIDGRSGGVPGVVAGSGNVGESNVQTEQLFMSFLSDLIQGLHGGAGAQLHIGGGLPFNLGDYAFGRDGLDAIVTQLMNSVEGTGPPPLSEERLKSLPETKITESQVKAKLQCSVCWEDFVINEKVIKLDCEHVYHSDCILPWLKLHGTCPVCRKDLNDIADRKEESGSNSETSPSQQNPTAANPSRHLDPTSNQRHFEDEMEFD